MGCAGHIQALGVAFQVQLVQNDETCTLLGATRFHHVTPLFVEVTLDSGGFPGPIQDAVVQFGLGGGVSKGLSYLL